MARKVCPYDTKSRQDVFKRAIVFLKTWFVADPDGTFIGMPGTFIASIVRCLDLYTKHLGYKVENGIYVEYTKAIRGLRAYFKKHFSTCLDITIWKIDIYDVFRVLKRTIKWGMEIDFLECDTTDTFINPVKQNALKDCVQVGVRCIWMCGSNRKVGTTRSRQEISEILGTTYKWETFTFRGVKGHQMILLVAVKQ